MVAHTHDSSVIPHFHPHCRWKLRVLEVLVVTALAAVAMFWAARLVGSCVPLKEGDGERECVFVSLFSKRVAPKRHLSFLLCVSDVAAAFAAALLWFVRERWELCPGRACL